MNLSNLISSLTQILVEKGNLWVEQEDGTLIYPPVVINDMGIETVRFEGDE